MTIKETLEYIHNVKWQGSKPGLSRTRRLLESLGNPERQLKFVHVAGTKGKGSTCAIIASVLQKAGYKTGLYTSPYVMCFNERMQIDGAAISDNELTELTEEIKPHADAMEDDPPTEFELITALAMRYFLKNACDIVVLEVGMGGELDSTNIIDTPVLAVITAIDYDHTEYLGPTISDIARAKAGIIKSGGDVLIYGGNPEADEVFRSVAKQRSACLIKADFTRIKNAVYSSEGTRFTIEPYKEMKLSLTGTFQKNNALVAVTALEMLRDKGFEIGDDDIAGGLAAVRWPGRFEFLGFDPVFILDGAHNPYAFKAVADSLRTYFGERKYIFIMGVSEDKDVKGMADIAAPIAERVFTVKSDSPRAMDAGRLAEIFSKCGVPVEACGSIDEGVRRSLEAAGESDIICALGSLFISADVKAAYARLK